MNGPAVPVVDLAPLLASSETGLKRVASELGRACRGIGFFYIVNHGIPEAVVADAFAASARFFALPAEVKERVSLATGMSNYGYVGIGRETLDPSRPGDAKEAFNLGREAEPDEAEAHAAGLLHAPNKWPDLPGFKAAMLGYFAAQRRLCERLHRAFAVDLGVGPDFFRAFIDRPMATLRLLHYPPHPGTFDGGLYGAGPHTDYGNVTVLAQDDAGGLEVRMRDGSWIDARPIPGAFVCNIGDCLMRWSNDVYVSTPHRVVNRSGRDRYSIAFFFDPNADATVECLPSCTSADRPSRYPPISGAAYLKERLDATYAHRRQ